MKQRPQENLQDRYKALEKLVGEYCIRCHDSEKAKGDLNFEILFEQEGFARDRKLWEACVEQIVNGDMPTKGAMPTESERHEMSTLIQQQLDNIDWKSLASPGDVPLPRLTSLEYAYALQDIIGLEIPFDDLLPIDLEGASGFSNDRKSLTLGEVELRGFILAATRAAEAAITVAKNKPVKINLESELGRFKSHLIGKEPFFYKKSKVIEFEGRWHVKDQKLYHTIEIENAGIYEFNLRAAIHLSNDHKGRYQKLIRGKSKEFNLKNARGALCISINDSIADKSNGIVIESEELKDHVIKIYLEKGVNEIGISYENLRVPFVSYPTSKPLLPFPKEQFREQQVPVTKSVYSRLVYDDVSHLLGKSNELMTLINKVNQATVSLYQKKYRPAIYYEYNHVPEYICSTRSENKQLEKSLQSLSQFLKIPQSKLNEIWKSKLGEKYHDINEKSNKFLVLQNQYRTNHLETYAPVVLDRITISGPLLPNKIKEFYKNIKLALEESNSGTNKILIRQILKRLFKRAPSEVEIDRYLSFYKERKNQGVGESIALTDVLTAMLVSPKVMYRNQLVKKGSSKLNSESLQARLSAWLWLTSPAMHSTVLNDSDRTIEQQVKKMVKDDRFDRFVESFCSQWLRLDRIGREVIPLKDIYPQFSQHLAKDMKGEVIRVFSRVFRENLPLTTLIDDNMTFLNERLARHYGIKGIKGDLFQLVKINPNKAGGLLGTAAVLTSTSSSVRPSPVQRGVMIAERILGTHFGSPPADVTPLPESAGISKNLSLRDSLKAHTKNPSCAACHHRIDPFGFALDRFDLVGRYRNKGLNGLIDESAELPDGSSIVGLIGVKQYVTLIKKDEFIRNMIERMLSFSLGRALNYQDEAAVREIKAHIYQNDLKAQSLLTGIALSLPFRERSATFAFHNTSSTGE